MLVGTLTGVPSSKPFVHLILDPELLERIDDFRFGNRLTSRNAAIRYLLEAALDQNPTPEPRGRAGAVVAPTPKRRGPILPRATEKTQ
jgi:metal-responsive CopG/Arc/MetJ family transcriptional regulator